MFTYASIWTRSLRNILKRRMNNKLRGGKKDHIKCSTKTRESVKTRERRKSGRKMKQSKCKGKRAGPNTGC